jgi:hypothetical protein
VIALFVKELKRRAKDALACIAAAVAVLSVHSTNLK